MVLAGLTLLFLIVKVVPGSAELKFLSPAFSVERQVELQGFQNTEQNIFSQFVAWLQKAVFLDFGYSAQSGLPVRKVLFTSLMPTLLLSALAIIWGLAISLPLALFSAKFRNRAGEKILTLVMVLLYSLPAFWIGLCLVRLLSFTFPLFPSSMLYNATLTFSSSLAKLANMIYHLFLPSLAMGLSLAAYFYRYLRAKLVEIMDSDYLLAAKARGLCKKTILFAHIVPNLILPLLSLFSTITPLFFSGAVTVEYIFSIPGIGRTMVNAAVARDLPVIMGGAAISFLAILVINSLIDLVMVFINPTLKTEWLYENFS